MERPSERGAWASVGPRNWIESSRVESDLDFTQALDHSSHHVCVFYDTDKVVLDEQSRRAYTYKHQRPASPTRLHLRLHLFCHRPCRFPGIRVGGCYGDDDDDDAGDFYSRF